MTCVFFLRHGPTKENSEGRIQGQQPGTILIPETERYVAAVTPLLHSRQLQVLLSSDLDRAVETRDILRRFLAQPDIKVGVSANLREKAMGLYEGMLWQDVPQEFMEQRGRSDANFRTFGGENDDDVLKRVATVLREFAQRYANMNIGVITHSGWLSKLVTLADRAGVLPDQWSNRTAIYELGLGPAGQLRYLHPINIEAGVTLDD